MTIRTAIAEAVALRDAAYKGPWVADGMCVLPQGQEWAICMMNLARESKADAAFIAAHHSHIELLVRVAERLEYYEMVLNSIASWAEGETVTGSFDEPNSASLARGALSNDSLDTRL